MSALWHWWQEGIQVCSAASLLPAHSLCSEGRDVRMGALTTPSPLPIANIITTVILSL